MKRSKPFAVALALAGAALVAATVYVAYPRNASVLQFGSNAVALVSPGSIAGERSANTAQFSGVLGVVGNGCLGIRAGDEEMAVAFPYGTKVTRDAAGLVLPGDVRVAVGDEISGEGGGREITAEDSWVTERWPQAGGACDGIKSVVALDDIHKVAGT